MENELVLKGLISPDTFDAGGLLSPEQGTVFYDYCIDETLLLKEVTNIKMTRAERQLDTLAIASRILRKGVVAQGVSPTGVTPSRRTLNTVKMMVNVELAYESLDVTIEKENLMDHIMQMIGMQVGNDLEDLGINGDPMSTDPFVSINKGWLNILVNDGGSVYDTGASEDYSGTVFKGMLNALGNKYQKDLTKLRFLVPPPVFRDYWDEIGGVSASKGIEIKTGLWVPTYHGIPVLPIASMPGTVGSLGATAMLMLSDPKNLAFGMNIRNVMRESDRDIRNQVIISVVTVHCDYEVINPEATVVAYDVTP